MQGEHVREGLTEASPAPSSPGLVLSLFPGIGLLDMAFEEAGFCVVRGPDLLWGGDIHRFHPPAGRFDGVIGGPPCQSWCGLGNVNKARWGNQSVLPDMIPEFVRCVEQARPTWFLMENVPAAPVPAPDGYVTTSRSCDNRWCGGEQQRRRRFSFGSTVPSQFHIAGVARAVAAAVARAILASHNREGGHAP